MELGLLLLPYPKILTLNVGSDADMYSVTLQ